MKTLKNLSLYVFASFFNKGINVLFLPILTTYLTPYDYGIANLFSVSVLFTQYLLMFGTDTVLNVEYFKRDTIEYRQLFSKTIIICFLVVILIGILSIFYKNYIDAFIGIDSYWAFTIPFIAFGTHLIDSSLNLLRNKKKAVLYVAISIGKTLLELFLIIGFIILLGMQWEGRLWANFGTIAIIVTGILIILRRNHYIDFIPSFSDVKYIVLLGLPFVINGFTTYVLTSANRYFMTYLLNNSKEIIGLFSVALSVGSLLLIMVNSLYTAVIPLLYERLRNHKEKEKEIATIIFYYTLALFVSLLFLYIGFPFFYKIFINDQFNSGLNYVPFILLGYFFWGINVIIREILIFFDKKRSVFINSILTIIFTIILNYYLINNYGLNGVLWSFVLSFGFIFFLNYISMLKFYKLNFLIILSPMKIKKLLT